MASNPNRAFDTRANRRMAPRSELRLEVTLRQAGEGTDIPAVIVNLSPTGFLAEIPEGVTLPELLDVDLLDSGWRSGQVVWTNGTFAGFNFQAPLSKAGVSAARLKGSFREQEAAKAAPTFSVGPSDPIWDMFNEAAPSENCLYATGCC